MKIGVHILPACMQGVYKRIHASRVTYKRLAHVHSPYVHIFQQYLQHTYVSIHVRRDVREAIGNVWQRLKNDGYENHL